MKRSITRWTTTLATAALLALPAVARAQEPAQPPAATPPSATPPSQQPPSQQPPTAQPPSQQPATQSPADRPTATTPNSPDQAVSPEDHLRQAKAALDSIPASSVTGRARTQMAELKRHVNALEHASAGSPAATSGTPSGSAKGTAPGAAAHAGANWGTEVAAIDKILTDLLGTSSATGAAGSTGTTGTAGATGTAGTTGSGSNKASAAVTLDDATRTKLTDVRTHITAYAVGMAAAPSAPKAPSTPKDDVEASPSAPMSSSPSTAANSTSSSSSTMTPGAAQSSAPAAGASTPSATGEQAAAESAQTPTAAQPQVDAEAARRHLTEARDTLSQLTQLPAAAQLTGEARTQISQLISNFNELITTQTEWRASYAKVSANLNALIGPENTDAEATGGAPSTAAPSATAPSPTAPSTAATPSATEGAVGTSGTTAATLDPAVRAKLMELRHHLSEFSKASGGAEK